MDRDRIKIIEKCAYEAIGSCKSIEECFDEHAEYIGSDIRFDDLTIEELRLVDQIVYTCAGCGWNCEAGLGYTHEDEEYCEHCIDEARGDDYDEEEEDYE